MLFIGHLIQNNIKSNTINSYILAIKKILQEDGIEVNENRSLLTSLTCACKLKNNQLIVRLPIHQNLIQGINRKLLKIFDKQPYLCKMYRAVFNCAYFGMFRIGKIAQSMHSMKARDVHIATNKPKLRIILR